MKNEYSKTRIKIHFDIDDAMDLEDLSKAFLAVNSQFNKYLRNHGDGGAKVNPADAHLFVTRIENKCIVAEIAGATSGILGATIPLLEYHNTFRGFISYFGDYIKAFKEKEFSEQPPKSDCTDYSEFLKGVSKNQKGAIDLELLEYDEDGAPKSHLKYKFAPDEVVRARQNALDYTDRVEESDEDVLKFQTLFFPQINSKQSVSSAEIGKSHDRGVIENISRKELPVFWASEMDTKKVKSYDGNPFSVSYLVDVKIGYRNGNPNNYTVLQLHKIIDEVEGQDEFRY